MKNQSDVWQGGDDLPDSIPGIRKYLWPKEVIDNWVRSGHIMSVEEN